MTGTLGNRLGTGLALGEISEGTRSLLVAGTGCAAGFLSVVCPRAWSKFVAIAKEKRGGPPVPSQARAELPHVPQVLPVLGVTLVSHALHEWDLTRPSKALCAHVCMILCMQDVCLPMCTHVFVSSISMCTYSSLVPEPGVSI